MWSFVQFNVSIQGSDGIQMRSDTGHVVRQALPIRHLIFYLSFLSSRNDNYNDVLVLGRWLHLHYDGLL